MSHQELLRRLRRTYSDLSPDDERALHQARIEHLGFERAIHLRDAEALASI